MITTLTYTYAPTQWAFTNTLIHYSDNNSFTLGCIVALIAQIRQQEKEHESNWLISACMGGMVNVLHNIYIIWNSHWLLHSLGRYYACIEWKCTPYQSIWITMSLIGIHVTHVPEFMQVISDIIWSTLVQKSSVHCNSSYKPRSCN